MLVVPDLAKFTRKLLRIFNFFTKFLQIFRRVVDTNVTRGGFFRHEFFGTDIAGVNVTTVSILKLKEDL